MDGLGNCYFLRLSILMTASWALPWRVRSVGLSYPAAYKDENIFFVLLAEDSALLKGMQKNKNWIYIVGFSFPGFFG